MKRYAAKLLFQFKVVLGGAPGKRRLCEERIVLLPARSAQAALTKAKTRGKRSEHRYTNDEGNLVCFEFVGVIDLLELGVECEADEVWYEITERLLPSERRSKLIPPESSLNAIRHESQGRGKSKGSR